MILCVCKCRVSSIVFILLFSSERLLCQCPDANFFKQQINTIYNSKDDAGTQLKGLLQVQQQMKTCHQQDDSCYMFLFQKLGVVYFKQSNYQKAIDFTKEAINTTEKCIGNHGCNSLPLIHSYYNLFYFYRVAAQVQKQWEAFDSCLKYVLRDNVLFDRVIGPLREKTDYLFNKGEYNLCIKHAQLGEDLINKTYHQKDSIQYIVAFVGTRVNALYISGNISLAENILQNKIAEFVKTGNSDRLGSFYNSLGQICRDKKEYAKALAYFERGSRANVIIKDRHGYSQNMATIGNLYSKYLNKHDTGLSYCTRALRFAVDLTDSLYILLQTANIYVLKGMYDQAQYFFQQGYDVVQPGINEVSLLENPLQSPGFNLLQNLSDLTTSKGDAFVQQYDRTRNTTFLQKALKVYRANDLFLIKIKTEQHLQFASNLVWRRTARSLYEHAIEASYAANNIEEAFYFFEKSRSILLNDQINDQRRMSDADISQIAGLKKTVLQLERDIAATPASSDEHLSLQEKLYGANLELDKTINTIKNKSTDTSTLTFTALKKDVLNNSKTLTEIFYGDSAVYVLTVSPVKQGLVKIKKQLYDSLVGSFNSFIANFGRLNRHFADFIQTGHQLYNLLFEGKSPPDGSIIISPDGVTFPFEALVMNMDSRQPDYFLNHFSTSYTYSVKYLTNQFSSGAVSGGSILGIAPVQYDGYKNLAELAGSDISLKNISNYYFGRVTNYVQKEATKNNFQQNFPGYSIIQLYTHAADSSVRNDPVIYFADSALYLSDLILSRRPVTKLVVLSACETAKGKFYEGEGVFSFNRGFAALGIPAAISNLWSVDNESAYRITELFYKYLSEGSPTDIALQKAKLEYIDNTSSGQRKLPYFWAASILTGKVDVIRSEIEFPWIKWTIFSMLFLTLTWLLKFYYGKSRRSRQTKRSATESAV